MNALRYAPPHSLPVRTLRTFGPDGSGVSEANVHCPKRGHALGVSECLVCEDRVGVETGEQGQGPVLRCDAEVANWGEPSASDERPPKTKGSEFLANRVPVSAIMATNVFALKKDLRIDAATALFLERRIGGAPVVDDRGTPVGMLTKSDLLRDQHERGATGALLSRPSQEQRELRRNGLEPGSHIESVSNRTVEEIMTPLAFGIHEEEPIAKAAALMAFEGIHRLPVLANEGQVVGVVTTLDISGWFAAAAGYMGLR